MWTVVGCQKRGFVLSKKWETTVQSCRGRYYPCTRRNAKSPARRRDWLHVGDLEVVPWQFDAGDMLAGDMVPRVNLPAGRELIEALATICFVWLADRAYYVVAVDTRLRRCHSDTGEKQNCTLLISRMLRHLAAGSSGTSMGWTAPGPDLGRPARDGMTDAIRDSNAIQVQICAMYSTCVVYCSR